MLSANDAARLRRGMALAAGLLGVAFAVSFVPGDGQDGYTAFWPQGWSFFGDRTPADVVVAYRRTAAGSGESLTEPLSGPADLAGLSRSGYVRIAQGQVLAERVARERWVECGGRTLQECLSAAGTPVALANDFAGSAVCGPAVLAELSRLDKTPTRVAAVDLSCR